LAIASVAPGGHFRERAREPGEEGFPPVEPHSPGFGAASHWARPEAELAAVPTWVHSPRQLQLWQLQQSLPFGAREQELSARA